MMMDDDDAEVFCAKSVGCFCCFIPLPSLAPPSLLCLQFYRVSADGSQLEEAAAGSKISYNMLVDDAVFVLDAWFEVYTWVGRSSEVALRKRGVALARELLEASGADRPQWVKDNGVERVMQNTERTVFREKFRGRLGDRLE